MAHEPLHKIYSFIILVSFFLSPKKDGAAICFTAKKMRFCDVFHDFSILWGVAMPRIAHRQVIVTSSRSFWVSRTSSLDGSRIWDTNLEVERLEQWDLAPGTFLSMGSFWMPVCLGFFTVLIIAFCWVHDPATYLEGLNMLLLFGHQIFRDFQWSSARSTNNSVAWYDSQHEIGENWLNIDWKWENRRIMNGIPKELVY